MRHPQALVELLACPACGASLNLVPGGLRCAIEGTLYPDHNAGMPDLRPEGSREPAESFGGQYRAARLAEGWTPLTPALAQALPHARPPGFARLYWQVRKESWARLAQLLASLKVSPLTLADAGSGFPWLSHRLAELGHRVIALDLSADADFGLAAARLFPTAAGWEEAAPLSTLPPGQFLPVLGDLARPPLAARAYGAVICNASLHYVNDVPAAVARLASSLSASGILVVVDSPTAARGAGSAGDRPGSRVLGRNEVEDAMRQASLTPTRYAVRRGALWQRHQLKNRLLRRPGFDFPIVVGRA